MMLCQRVEEFRRETMLQNYNESFPELRYPQLHMAPSSEFNSLVQHTEQPWYNNYHNGLPNGGGDYYSSRGTENKTPTEWNNYHSDNESPFIPSQINNNSCESQYSSNGMHSIMEQPLPVEMRNHNMVNSASDSLAVNGVNGLMQNGVDSRIMDCPITPKEEETLPKIDGPKPSTNSSSEIPPKDGSRDAMKLPGFHQTFGNITEIGRFSQHDDYFESTPTPDSLETPKISDEITDTAPKRKPRGRKRKQPEPRELFSRQPPPYTPPDLSQQCLGGSEPPHSWSYTPHPNHHHHSAPPHPSSTHPGYDHHPSQFHHHHQPPPPQQWRSHPHHPYYQHQQHHFHHHHHYPPPPAPPPPPPNPYYQPYNDCPPPYHYNSYPSNWHMNRERDYMAHNYPSYV